MRKGTDGNSKLKRLGDLCKAFSSLVVETELEFNDPLIQFILKEIAEAAHDLMQ